MASLTPTYIDALGSFDPTGLVAASAGGDQFNNLVATTERTFLRVVNGGGSPITVTIASQVLCNQGYTHDLAVSVAASGEEWIGPLSRDRFNDGNGNVQITYSGVTSVTVQAVRIA